MIGSTNVSEKSIECYRPVFLCGNEAPELIVGVSVGVALMQHEPDAWRRFFISAFCEKTRTTKKNNLIIPVRITVIYFCVTIWYNWLATTYTKTNYKITKSWQKVLSKNN